MNARNSPSPFLPPRIVVGVGSAGQSDHAILQAVELGKRLSAPVRLVHAMPSLPDVWPGIDVVRGEAMTSEMLDTTRRVLEERVHTILSSSRVEPVGDAPTARASTAVVETDGVPVRVLAGHPVKVLLDQVRGRPADWIVLGSHAKRGRLDFGGTLRALFAKARVPVWVQAHHPARSIGRILVAVDLSAESLLALSTARELAHALGASVHALYCFDPNVYVLSAAFDHSGYAVTMPIDDVRRADEERFERAVRTFEWRGVPYTREVAEGVPADEITSRSLASDLVVLGAHGRTGLASTVLGGTAYSVLKRAERPVLVVRRTGQKFLL